MRRNLPELFSHSLRGARPCISFLVSVIPYAAVRSTIRTTSDFALVFIFARRRELSDTFGDTTYTRTDPNYPKSVSKVFDFLNPTELIDALKVFPRPGSSFISTRRGELCAMSL